MKCKFIDTTNTNFKYKRGQIGIGEFSNTMFWFDNFHTSYVVSVDVVNKIMTVKTRNSKYIFKILDDTVVEPFSIDEDNRVALEDRCRVSDSLFVS